MTDNETVLTNQQKKPQIRDVTNYKNVLMEIIASVFRAISSGKDGYAESVNLIHAIPDSFYNEIKDQVEAADTILQQEIPLYQPYFARGTTLSKKITGEQLMIKAHRKYSRTVTKAVINLLMQKNLCFETEKSIEIGGLDHYGDSENPA